MKIDPCILVDIEVEIEIAAQRHPNYPDDPLRRVALMCEEAGEALQAALDLTRLDEPDRLLRDHLRHEVVHTAAMAIKLLHAMDEES